MRLGSRSGDWRRRSGIRLALAVLLSGLTPVVAWSQEPWRTSYFPYLLGNPTDGLTLVLRWQRTKDAPYFLERSDEEDLINPLSFRGAFSVEAGAGTLGTRFVRAELRGPGLRDGWRIHAVVGAERTGRFGYYGLGGGFVDNPDRRTESANDNFFRAHRERVLAQVEVTRRIRGPLRFALAARLDHTTFSRLPDSTLLLEEFGRGDLGRTDLVIRPALVVDSRDREFVPGRGLLIEAGAGFGTGGSRLGLPSPTGDGGVYAMGLIHARAYLSPREGTVLAGRFLWRGLDEDAPLSARYYVTGWEREIAPSGPTGHRSFPLGALAGTQVYLTSLEVRHDILNAGDFGAVTALGFLDWGSGRDDLGGSADALGGGAGLAIRVLRSAILTLNFAAGPNGFNFSMGNGWSF